MIGNDWDIKLEDILTSIEFKRIYKVIKEEYKNKIIYPKECDIFKALKLSSYKDTKVVIVGQDPYHGENEANGLAFSVPKGIKIPPSLQNIFKELKSDLGISRNSGDLSSWAKQGVLLLNSVLTVEKDKPASHKCIGWEYLTNYIIKILNNKKTPVIFILWGNFAKEKEKFITNPKHFVISSSHPSPFSARLGFFGSRPFSQVNNFLVQKKMTPIDWSL